jgi:uncharacterized protein (TIGR02145 family)
VTTAAAQYITSRSATVSGTVSTGGSSVVQRGVCYATTSNPTTSSTVVVNGSGDGTYECALLGLAASTTYYARAYYTDRKGNVKYGNQVSFTTLVSHGTVTDADGNVYETVTIGDRVWTMSNLRTTKYRDGSAIEHVTDDTGWGTTTSGAYCSYSNNDANVATYGRLYNSYAVLDARSIAPAGWHVATDADWDALASSLGGSWIAGGRLKSVGTTLWRDPNAGANNAASFFAVPGGYRIAMTTSTGGIAAIFEGLGIYAYFWTSTEVQSSIGLRPASRFIDYAGSDLVNSGQHGVARGYGYAVRLVKD